MKKSIIILLLVLLDMTQAVAQEYEYVPFVREGVKWVYYYINEGNAVYPADPNLQIGTVYLNLELKGDTVINGKTFKAMHKYYGDAIRQVNDTVPIYLREENKVVYGIVPDGKKYADCPIGNLYDLNIFYSIDDGEEFVLYDFNDPVNYWEAHINDSEYEDMNIYEHLYTDTIVIGHHKAKRYVGNRGYFGQFSMIEGIGVDAPGSGYTLFPFRPMTTSGNAYFCFSHIIEDGEIIYKGLNYQEPEPEPEPQESDYLPIAREGVKWVNEKVIVNHGDTTRYYYSYEICGNDTTWPNMINKVYKACYYYTGNELDVNTDSLIAGLDSSKGFTTCGRNDAYQENCYQNKNLISFGQYTGDGQDTFLYYFLEGEGPEPDWDNTIEYYLACQQQSAPTPEDQTLTHENFTQVDPVEIEGVTCRRWCYTGENGEPLAYIIEGIGFDSRDMGDLLTPFTRRPDPNADYQEWCGLSHVVKDGQIIYKGMHYRHGAFTGIDKVVSEQSRRAWDGNYYNLMGQPVGTEVPTTPGIYIHQGKKLVVR